MLTEMIFKRKIEIKHNEKLEGGSMNDINRSTLDKLAMLKLVSN